MLGLTALPAGQKSIEKKEQATEKKGEEVFVMGSGVTDPQLIVKTTPSYTSAAIRAKVEGTVVLRAIIRKNGQTDSFEVLRGLGHGLEEAAIQEISANWKFLPGTLNGKPVDVLSTIEVQFNLKNGHPGTSVQDTQWEQSMAEANQAYQQGRYAEAEPLYQRALAIREEKLGPEHLYVALTLHNLALLYQNQRKYAEAEPLYQRALAIREKVLGPEHPRVAFSLNGLASLYNSQGKYEEAEPLFQRSLAIREKVLGSEHSEVAWR